MQRNHKSVQYKQKLLNQKTRIDKRKHSLVLYNKIIKYQAITYINPRIILINIDQHLIITILS